MDLIERARQEVERGVLPAAQIAVARDGELIVDETFGAPPETRFVVWSITKGIFGGAFWRAMGDGAVDVEAPVSDYIPGVLPGVRVEHLLLHTAGFPMAPMPLSDAATSEGRRRRIASWRLDWEPGTRFAYHGVSAHWVLAEVLVTVTGRDHRDLVNELLDELGIETLRLGQPDHPAARPVAVGEPATEEEWAATGWPPVPYTSPGGDVGWLARPEVVAAGIPAGGAVGRAADVALFYQRVLHDGREGRPRVWQPGVLHDVTQVVRNTFPDESKADMPANRTRGGLVVRGDDGRNAARRMHFGPATSPRTFGHDGAGGQVAWADPESGLSFCFLTNGMDRNLVREYTRNQDLSRLATTAAG